MHMGMFALHKESNNKNEKCDQSHMGKVEAGEFMSAVRVFASIESTGRSLASVFTVRTVYRTGGLHT